MASSGMLRHVALLRSHFSKTGQVYKEKRKDFMAHVLK
jgi:hypothetical protein